MPLPAESPNARRASAGGPRAGVRVAVAARAGAAGAGLLDDALDAAGFWALLRGRCSARRVGKAELSIAIKPDLDVFEAGAATGADPALVEALIARLRRAGYGAVTLCDGRNRPDDWLHNREALCVPDLLGYAFEAPPGSPYDVEWSGDDAAVVPIAEPDTSGALRVNGAWARADVRISFARAKTDDAWGYALSAANLLGLVAPDSPAAAWPAPERVLHLLRRVPPHFALIDATVSSHGSSGSRVSLPLATDTVIASRSALLADWAAALKMRADPHTSPINRLALDELGLPGTWALAGDAAPWEGWRNPGPALLEAVRGRARWPQLDALARAVLQPVDRERFPFRDIVLDQVSATVLAQLQRITDPQLRDAIVGLLARLLNVLAGARDAFVSNVTKADVPRSIAPLTLNVDRLRPAEFARTRRLVEQQLRVLDGAPEDARGFRFRTIGGHIHFAAARQLAFDFDDFTTRVDVSAGIRLMNDYLGGSWIVVERDAAGRPLRQAERNLYLPQPNWVGAFGGEPIDVEKVEQLSYTPDRHDLWWRTVRSPNGSAESDDGAVTFRRTPGGAVEVRVFARQRFRLPAPVAALRVERWPTVHDELVADAYARFFDGTLANMRALYERRPYRIGRPPLAGEGAEAGASELRAVLAGAFAVLSRALGWAPAGGVTADGSQAGNGGPHGSGAVVEPLFIDELGFRHFPGQAVPAFVAVPTNGAGHDGGALTPMVFLAELGRAVGRDLAALGVPAPAFGEATAAFGGGAPAFGAAFGGGAPAFGAMFGGAAPAFGETFGAPASAGAGFTPPDPAGGWP